ASRELLAVALVAYEHAIRERPRAAAIHDRYAWFLGRVEEVRRSLVGTRVGLSPELMAVLSGESLMPRALEQLGEAIRQDPGNPDRHRSLGIFALVHVRELPDASLVVAEGFRQAILLDRWMLPDIADRLLHPPGDNAELLLASVPRRVPLLIDLGRPLERRGRTAAVAAAFETALGVASGPAEQAEVRIAHSEILLGRKDVN